ncbi:23S rRNA (guanosine(2251)-2'-O)-methyltransferase RlmB [Candidatus Phytoplasma phoenicium]|uniref:23S rRNA (Guanosine(2251)-2'-O)-methyltransferase RlmB n=1 Tax=Candidatus Phytoplasma phoenicium TaxID=198422 RepID=A0A2S8NU09_9MOLU|nr:23S rRNA (guanosine(2251)-2'-O)-methyltransferase RlmB [Candidatus Phytoplasma phoenicium]
MIIYGKNIIKEAIKNKRPIYNLYIDKKFKDFVFLKILKKNQLIYHLVDKHQLNEKTKNHHHQGVVAEVQDYNYYNLQDYLSLCSLQKFLILDKIHDPQNFGSILRTLATTDFDGVIIGKKNQVLLTGTVAKASSGALEYVKIFLVKNLHQTILQLKKNQVSIIGTDAQATNTFHQIPRNTSIAIILGNEGVGMSPLLKKNCDLLVKIPMKGFINSLNVSVAAALLMYFAQF